MENSPGALDEQRIVHEDSRTSPNSDRDDRLTTVDGSGVFAMTRLLKTEAEEKKRAKSKKKKQPSPTSLIDGLKILYNDKLKPLEVTSGFNFFDSSFLTSADFDAKPMVMLLGQYSTGKTTFIKHLLGRNYPGSRIGPEPTTNQFVVVMSRPAERTIPGHTVAVQTDLPFSGLTSFGGPFLSKFQVSQMQHPLLENMTFVDTPGVVCGENQPRNYDFTGVISWFAAKCDVILLLFDPQKLDISDEFEQIISSLQGYEDKIRVILNKADQVDNKQLRKVYGALMWSLGKVLSTPKAPRVYIGSFDKKPEHEAAAGNDFEQEQDDLLLDLEDVPKKACDRKINDFVKRARSAKIHSYIISQLMKDMPPLVGKAKAKKKLIQDLEKLFAKVRKQYGFPAGDFPSVEQFREVLNRHNFADFGKLDLKMIQAVDEMLSNDIPQLLRKFQNLYG